jgi:diadenylate cyclase
MKPPLVTTILAISNCALILILFLILGNKNTGFWRHISGKLSFLKRFNFVDLDNISQKRILAATLSEIAFELSAKKIGALIAIEKNNELKRYYNQNANINADISVLLCLAIFQKNSPLHDGAIIIKDNKIWCASAYFPTDLEKNDDAFGARHRAALGITNATEGIAIVVSETNGKLSIAKNGTFLPIRSNEEFSIVLD